MSLYLKEQKLGSHSSPDSSSHKFMLKGRQTGGMHRGHGWVFRAESRDTMLAWYEGIKNMTEKTGLERDAFVRKHTRTASNGSARAPSVSSDGGMEEDEADQVPYSASTSQIDPTSPREQAPQRPQPGGRFPSDLNVDRHLHMPLSPSSGTSSDDRDVIAAAGALPGSGIPFGQPEQQMEKGGSERPRELAAMLPHTPGVDDARNDHSILQSPNNDYNSLENDTIHQYTSATSTSQTPNAALQPAETGRSVASEQLDPQYRVHAVPEPSRLGSVSGPVSPISATFVHETNTVPVELSSIPSPPIEDEKPATLAFSMPPAVSSHAFPTGGLATPDSTMTALSTSTIATNFGVPRPPLASQQSGQTVSDLHVPGDYPRQAKAK